MKSLIKEDNRVLSPELGGKQRTWPPKKKQQADRKERYDAEYPDSWFLFCDFQFGATRCLPATTRSVKALILLFK